MGKPWLMIVNGLPASGKTTLAGRLAADVRLPLFSRDGIYETLYDALDCNAEGSPRLLGAAAFSMMYAAAGSILAAGKSLIVEGFFGRPDLRTAEFLQLQRAADYNALQIVCRADGQVLLERFLARAKSKGRHGGHQDLEWLEQNKERLLRGQLEPLALDGPVLEIDTTEHDPADYAGLLQCIRAVGADAFQHD